MRVLVAGGAGDVGAMVVPELAHHHDVCVLDLRPPEAPVRFVEGSVTDPDAVARAATGCDAVIYLAMGRKADWRSGADWAASHFAVSVHGVYVTLAECARAGVGRAVYASSMSVFERYASRDYAAEPEPDATEPYGLTKRLGEQVCAAAVRAHGMSIAALRLVLPLHDAEWLAYTGQHRAVATAASDVANAFRLALERPVQGFAAFTIAGDVERSVLDWSAAREAFGWAPQRRLPRA